MSRQSLQKPEQLPLNFWEGVVPVLARRSYRTPFSIEYLWVLPAVLLLTVRDMFCLELVVPSDWQCTVMKGSLTQESEMRQGERKKNCVIQKGKLLGYLHTFFSTVHKCRSEYIIQTTNEGKRNNQTPQPLELNKDLIYLGRYPAPFKSARRISA